MDMKTRLLTAARDELTANGGVMEVQAVARRAGVSVGIAYHHFGSKAGLIAGVVEDFHAQLRRTLEQETAHAETDWSQRERIRLRAFLRIYLEDPFGRILLGRLAQSPEVIDVQRAFTAEELREGARNLIQGQRLGIVRADLDPEVTVAMLLGGIRQTLDRAIEAEIPPSLDHLETQIWAFISGALALPATDSRRKSHDAA
ncbi:MAG: TetR/AcrR family transcriptional regulator [Pseudomonadota bacterium]|jgi:AcrR family transcriptional regulator